MPGVSSASIAAALLLATVIVFQSALAAKAPWGRMAYGSRATQQDGTLSSPYRLASCVASLLLATAAWSFWPLDLS